MNLFSENTMTKFMNVKSFMIDMTSGEDRTDVDTMTASNIRTARRRKDPRSDATIAQHTQQGYGAELTLRSIEEVSPSAEISPYFKGLDYKKVMTDFYCEEIPCQMKTAIGSTLERNRKWYLSQSQFDSILGSHSYYKAIFLFKAECIKEYVYQYDAFLMIDANKFMNHVKPNKGPYSPYYFDYLEAINKGSAILL